MPKQVIRLLIAFIIFTGLFLVIRHFLTPKSFGKYGHYRAAALSDIASNKLFYADANACSDCHSEIDSLKSAGPHKSINCQTCHGPGMLHTLNPDSIPLPKPSARAFCERCHSKIAGRPSVIIKQIDATEHYPDGNCIDCHISHNPLKYK